MPLPHSEQDTDDAEPEAADWRSRVIMGDQLGGVALPPWAERSYQILHDEVTDDAYPCFFGVQAERRGEMFYTFLSRGEEESLIESMATFAELAKLTRYDKNNIAVFFEPDPKPLGHREYHDRFWRTLQRLHDADTHPGATQHVDPAEPAWEFCYQGVEMFVVCACPSFEKRRSRNLGPGMVLLFQPRSVFIDKITNKVIGRRAREQVRKRLKAWDALGAHPDLGFYGDPGNLEWKQYFLPDDNRSNTGVCPFSNRRSRSPIQSILEPRDDSTEVVMKLRLHALQTGDEAALHFFAEGEAVAHTLGYAELERRTSQSTTMPALSADHPITVQTTGSAVKHSSEHQSDLTDNEAFPLTPAQEALWFLWRMDPDSSAYNVSSAVELEGVLDGNALRRALNVIVERHAILRTGFMDICGEVRQCVDSDATRAIDWVEHDLCGRVSLMTVACDILTDRGHQGFDLGGDGLLRCTLLRIAPDRYVLHMCTHQIVLDAWSFNLLRREWMECYLAVCNERAPKLPAVSVQFGEHGMQTRSRRDTVAEERQLEYWRERLGDPSYTLDLPFDHPRTAHRKATAGRLIHVITPSVHAAVRHLAAAHYTTPFVVMLSAFALLLQRYSGQRDVRMAVPLLRREPSVDGALIGHFMNTAVIRLEVPTTKVFSALIEQAKRYLAEAHANGDLPLARLVDALRVHRSLANTPLCQVMFNQMPTFVPEVHGNLRVRPFDDVVGHACYDLSMNIAIDRERGVLFLDYSSALFDACTAQRMLTHYLELLEQVTQPATASEVMASLRLSHAGNAEAAAA